MTGKKTVPSVAVLGAGIMGCSVALYLARKKIPVVLFDSAGEPFTGASRWNEGKIHLGYLYGADTGLATAKKLLPGGLNFPYQVEELTGQTFDEDMVTQTPDRYLLHKDSVVDPDSYLATAMAVSKLVREHSDLGKYFDSLDECTPRQLTPHELAAEYNPDLIRAAIEVPERSVITNRVADQFVAAVNGEPLINLACKRRVVAVKPRGSSVDSWLVESRDTAGESESQGPFGAVVNALWEGRRAIDASVGLDTSDKFTNRFRLSLFARLRRPVDLRSAVIAVGPFGDVKNYNGYDLYLSWYEAGLLKESHDLEPPVVPLPDSDQQAQIIQTKLDQLGEVIPGITSLPENFEAAHLQGGWVYAAGQGSLSDARSTLHRRNRVGAYSRQRYFSVDTGKYSIAPWLARQLADDIEAVIR